MTVFTIIVFVVAILLLLVYLGVMFKDNKPKKQSFVEPYDLYIIACDDIAELERRTNLTLVAELGKTYPEISNNVIRTHINDCFHIIVGGKTILKYRMVLQTQSALVYAIKESKYCAETTFMLNFITGNATLINHGQKKKIS